MKKMIATLLLAAFSLTTFAMMVPQQDTTRKHQKDHSKQKSKEKKTMPPRDTVKTDTVKKM